MQTSQSEEEEVDDPMDKAVKELNYKAEDPGSYGGVENFFPSAKKAGLRKVTPDRVKQFLADQESYSLHKPARPHIKRNTTSVKGIDAQWQADLRRDCSVESA